jgi:DNA processing protein
MQTEKRYQLALSLINGIGSINAKKLLAYVGSPEAVFKEKKQNLVKIPGIGEKVAKEVFNTEILQKTDAELNFIEKHNITTFFYTEKEYPNRLKQYDDAPIILFFKGQSNLNQQKIISIVGTRKATHVGLENCKKLIENLSSKGHKTLIVSGLAYGIDIQAHKIALKNEQPTVAVLGHGLNMIYPSAHKNIAKEIVNHGGLLSELPSSAVLDPAHFVKRNRIIAGLADATVVVESAKKGGSLITAKIANDYNKDVFAFPGRVNDKYSEGCNFLIKTNQASLIESADDIEYIMGWTPSEKEKVVQSQLFVELNEAEEKIVTILRENGKMAIDILSIQAKMPVSKVSTILLKLEFAGVVISFPGKIYSATN